MPLCRTALVAAVSLIAINAAAAQQHPAQADSTRARIHRTLRAFYFHLAHDDWEALAADILPAKVVAHRSAPDALAVAAGGGPLTCAAPATPQVDQATIVVDGDWAEVSVPRCTASPGADEFRLIRFERRWRFVFIHLFEERANLVTGR